jgi:hypothetical protein
MSNIEQLRDKYIREHFGQKTAYKPNRDNKNPEFEHVTDGSPCPCDPIKEDGLVIHRKPS